MPKNDVIWKEQGKPLFSEAKCWTEMQAQVATFSSLTKSNGVVMVVHQTFENTHCIDRPFLNSSAESARHVVGEMSTRLPSIITSRPGCTTQHNYFQVTNDLSSVPQRLSHYSTTAATREPLLRPILKTSLIPASVYQYTGHLEPRSSAWYEGYFPSVSATRYVPYPNTFGTQQSRFMTSGAMTDHCQRKNATRESTSTLKAWLTEHSKNPYPTKGEKVMLAVVSKMTLTQVSTWFANARRRLKKENKMTWVPKHRTNESSHSSYQCEAVNGHTGPACISDEKAKEACESLRSSNFKSDVLLPITLPCPASPHSSSSSMSIPIHGTATVPDANRLSASVAQALLVKNQRDDELFAPAASSQPTTFLTGNELPISENARSPHSHTATAAADSASQHPNRASWHASPGGKSQANLPHVISPNPGQSASSGSFSNLTTTLCQTELQEAFATRNQSCFSQYAIASNHLTSPMPGNWPESLQTTNSNERTVTMSTTSHWSSPSSACTQQAGVTPPLQVDGTYTHQPSFPHLHLRNVGQVNSASFSSLSQEETAGDTMCFNGGTYPSSTSDVEASRSNESYWTHPMKISTTTNTTALPVW